MLKLPSIADDYENGTGCECVHSGAREPAGAQFIPEVNGRRWWWPSDHGDLPPALCPGRPVQNVRTSPGRRPRWFNGLCGRTAGSTGRGIVHASATGSIKRPDGGGHGDHRVGQPGKEKTPGFEILMDEPYEEDDQDHPAPGER